MAPITLRGLVGMLLVALPAEARSQVGAFLLASGGPCEDAQSRVYESLMTLQSLKNPVLDCYPAALVVGIIGINGNAPQRVVVQAVEQLVRQWKQKHGVPEQRRRDDKLADYLRVWDLREGWAWDHYDGGSERTLRQIAEQLKVPISTVANRYRSAFRLIVGRDYTPNLWARLLGFLKVCALLGPDGFPRRTLRRPWRSPKLRLIPETALAGAGRGEDEPGLLETFGGSQAETDYTVLVLDIQHLVKLGRTNEAIIEELELTSSEANAAIDYLRGRDIDQL